MKRSISMACAACFGVMLFACGGSDVRMVRAVDRENMSMVLLAGEDAALQEIYDADFVIVGGSLSGLTAAFAACAAGRQTVIIEETDQLATDVGDTTGYLDNRFADTTGSSERVKQFKDRIRGWYRIHDRPQPRREPPVHDELADFDTTGFGFEPDAVLAAADSVFARYIERGQLTVLTRHRVAEVITFGHRIQSLNVVDLDRHLVHQVRGWVFIDATETGELVPLAGVDFTIGAQGAASDSAAMYDVYYYRDEIAGKKNGDSVVPLLSVPPDGDGVVGTVSFARAPRRINGYHTIERDEIAASSRQGPRAAFFHDSVGIGYSPIMDEGDTAAERTRPFQIPLGALVPQEVANLVVAGSAIGVDGPAAGAFRSPSVRMAIGEAAGVVAEYSAARDVSPRDILDDPARLLELQEFLVRRRNVPIYWYDNVAPGDSAFVDAQMAPFRDPAFDGTQRSLSYEPAR